MILMNIGRKILAVALLAIMMGFSAFSPALATHTEDHKRNLYWYQESCPTEKTCQVLVDADRNGFCNLVPDSIILMPKGFAQTLPPYNEECGLIF